MNRRALLKNGALLTALAPAGEAVGICAATEYQPAFPVRERLDQGPFDIDQDDGWLTSHFTTPSEKPIRNPGLGLVGYTWEEGGPSLAVRTGERSLESQVQALAGLPFVDVLYIRCDWRHVQTRPGRLDLHSVWAFSLEAAKRHGLRVAFRVHLSNPNSSPEKLLFQSFCALRFLW